MKELHEYCNALKVKRGNLKYYPPKTQFEVPVHFELDAIFVDPTGEGKSGN